MTALPVDLFNVNDNVVLRIWFDDIAGNGVHQLSPDQPVTSVPFAFRSATIDDDAVTSDKIADGAVGASEIATDAVRLLSALSSGTVDALRPACAAGLLPAKWSEA